MQASPKYVFFGIIALGLPVAVTLGWLLSTPAAKPPVATAPGGAGAIGAAPERVETSQPVTPARYDSQPPRRGAPATTSPASPASSPPLITATPSAPGSASSAPPPVLDLPPVPTPTEILNPPASPSATPSGSRPVQGATPTEVAGGQ